jgi:hypothetical protein
MVVLTLLVYVSLGGVIAHMAGVSSAVLTGRHGFRAAMMMPADLRSFPVERYAGPADEFTYTMSTHKSGRTLWCLRIDAIAPRRHWQDAFEEHMRRRGFRRVGRHETTPSRLFLQFGASGRRVFRLQISTRPAETQYITLEYHPGPNAREWTNPRYWARYLIYKVKHYLRRSQPPPNAMTLPS